MPGHVTADSALHFYRMLPWAAQGCQVCRRQAGGCGREELWAPVQQDCRRRVWPGQVTLEREARVE